MTPAHDRLTDDALTDALQWRADGPSATADLFDDVMTLVSRTSQRRGWTFWVADATRPVVIFAALAALLVTILGTLFVSGATPFHRDPIDLLDERPFIAPFRGFPPEGAVPSTPETGQLVMNEWAIHPFRSASVYADGRLIWEGEKDRYVDSGGWVEQRLTPKGVDLLRTHAFPLSVWPATPASTLPGSAWVDRALRGYVPSRYMVCFEFRVPDLQGSPVGLRPVDALELLPNDVAVSLRDAWVPRIPVERLDEPQDPICGEVTTDAARTIRRALTQAGADGDDLYYTLRPRQVEPNVIHVSLVPLLPNGDTALGVG